MYKEMETDHLPSIPDFFKNRDIFVTGGSGFMGKVLIEKILYDCPDVGNIYVLLRPKKGKHINDRLNDIKNLELFQRLRHDRLENMKKIIGISGDVASLKLGISDDDKKLMSNVSIVFHVAASVRFDDPLKDAILMNTRGTREVIEFCETLKNLKVMMHVSTTYCNPDWKVIEEKIYPPYADWRQAIQIAETLDTTTLDTFAPKYMGNQPNTYTFTKSLAEQIVNEYKEKIPMIIFRPSIVISSVSEPMPGWIDNFNGPIGLMIGCGIGINRTLYSNPNNIADYIPVDVAIRAMLTAVWKRGTQEPCESLQIYNCISSDVKPTTFKEIVDMGKEMAPKYPLDRILWAPGGSITNWRAWNYIKVILLHVLPALLVDQIFKIGGRRPFVLKLQRRIYQANLALAYFVLNVWEFKNKNLYSLNEGMKEEDRVSFQFNHQLGMETKQYFEMAALGARRYLLHEKDEDLPAARIRFRRIQILDKVVKTFVYTGLIYYFFTVINIMPLILNYLNIFTMKLRTM